MAGPWIGAFVALWITVAVLAIAVLGTLRRVGTVLEQSEARLTRSGGGLGGAPPGTLLPEYDLFSIDGRQISSRQLVNRAAIHLFMSASCAPCASLAAELEHIREVAGIPLFVILPANSRPDYALPDGPAIFYQDGRASAAFQNYAAPQAFLVARGGTIVDHATPNFLRDLRKLASTLERGDIENAETESVQFSSR